MNSRLAIAALFAAIATSNIASADEVDRCVAASEKGQKERRAGHLSEARAAFIQCAADKCPSVVKTACTEWLDQVNAALPTILIAVTDAEHKDIVDARIAVDGKEVALGRAVQLDPGPHTISVEADGFQPGSQSIVARETEHNRAVNFTLAPKKAVAPGPGSSQGHESKAIRPITWITGGLSLAAFGSFAVFGVRGRSLASDLRDTCKPNCSEADRATAHTSYVIADISLIAAVILGGVSIYTYFANRD